MGFITQHSLSPPLFLPYLYPNYYYPYPPSPPPPPPPLVLSNRSPLLPLIPPPPLYKESLASYRAL